MTTLVGMVVMVQFVKHQLVACISIRRRYDPLSWGVASYPTVE
ncbi:hypothetical protein [Nostoc flagelliforme]